VSFARMIAKIAYAMAFAKGLIARIDGNAFVLPDILGQRDEIGRWVGTLDKPIEVHRDQLHRVLIYEDIQRGILGGEVHLFSDSQTPSYGVILGRLK